MKNEKGEISTAFEKSNKRKSKDNKRNNGKSNNISRKRENHLKK